MNDEQLDDVWLTLLPIERQRRRIDGRVFAWLEARDTPLAVEWLGLFRTALEQRRLGRGSGVAHGAAVGAINDALQVQILQIAPNGCPADPKAPYQVFHRCLAVTADNVGDRALALFGK